MAADDLMTVDNPIAQQYKQTFSIRYNQRFSHSVRQLDDAIDE